MTQTSPIKERSGYDKTKFYAFLAALDKVTPADLAGLKATIALHLPDWQSRCERYNNVEIDDWREDS